MPLPAAYEKGLPRRGYIQLWYTPVLRSQPSKGTGLSPWLFCEPKWAVQIGDWPIKRAEDRGDEIWTNVLWLWWTETPNGVKMMLLTNNYAQWISHSMVPTPRNAGSSINKRCYGFFHCCSSFFLCNSGGHPISKWSLNWTASSVNTVIWCLPS